MTRREIAEYTVRGSVRLEMAQYYSVHYCQASVLLHDSLLLLQLSYCIGIACTYTWVVRFVFKVISLKPVSRVRV